VKNFIGHNEELKKINSFFKHEAEQPRILVLHALGGQGKTQIALKYCHRSRIIYGDGLWINGTSTSTATQAFVGIAQELNCVAVAMLNDDDAKVSFVLRTLGQRDSRWLMVYDNCDEPASFSGIEAFIPQGISSDEVLLAKN